MKKIGCLLVVPILAATAIAAQQQGANPAAQAPTAKPAPSASARQAPSDQKAYTETSRIKDPQKKIEALEKFLEQYPDSYMTISAHLDILDALTRSQPANKDKILARAELALQKVSNPQMSGAYASSIASRLMKAGLLAEAEQYARKSIASTEEYLAQTIKELQRQKARPLGIIGHVLLKQGKLKDAEQKLKEAYAINPQAEGVAASLAEMAEKDGKENEAFDYLLAAGRLKEDDRRKLESYWRNSHGGAIAGLEEELDARYHKEYANLVPVTRYQPTANRSGRAVLAEMFTGAGCPPCVSADLGFEAMMERYSRDELIVLMYHQHIPLPDPLTSPASHARYRYYGGGGAPAYTIDGLALQSGGGGKEQAKAFYQRINPLIEKRLEVAPEAALKLDASMENGIVRVAARVALDNATIEKAKAESKPAVETKNPDAAAKPRSDAEPSYRLHVLLVEETLRYSGENGIRLHPMVVRAMGGFMAGGFSLDPANLGAAKGATVNASFDIAAIVASLKKYAEEFETSRSDERGEPFTFNEKKHEINVNGLSIAAFLQDHNSGKVLQAATVRLNGKGVAIK